MGIINGRHRRRSSRRASTNRADSHYTNWRWIFFVTRRAWACSGPPGGDNAYFPSGEHPQLTAQNARKLPAGACVARPPQKIVAWLDLLRISETWGVGGREILSDAAWYFYLFWLPKYLYDARGFDIKAVGAIAWIPNAAAGIGCLLGGWFSSHLVRRQFSLNVARKVALGLSAAVMPLILLVTRTLPVAWAIAIFSLAYFGQQSWSTLVMVLPTDLFPSSVVGAVAGLVGFGGAMGGIAFRRIGRLPADHGFGYERCSTSRPPFT